MSDKTDCTSPHQAAEEPKGYHYKPKISAEPFICLAVIILLFTYLAIKLTFPVLIKTIMDMAFDLLINTCLFIMSLAVIMGALSELLAEFGIIELFNTLLSPLMKPLYGMPGAASLGIITTFMSDNPAILTLAKNPGFKTKFKYYQLPALCNLGTAFGMGLLVISFMSPLQLENIGTAILCGLLGAIAGSIISTRLMLRKTRKYYKDQANIFFTDPNLSATDKRDLRLIREGSGFQRVMSALLDGGKNGVEIGLGIIPGVLTICTLVLLFTNQPTDTFPGVALIPKIGQALNFILQPLFGFSSPEAISVPITALGSAGAAMALVPKLVDQGLAYANDIAVFTAMCMCWSGYLSTHIAMMDSLDCRPLSSDAIISHTIGGLGAGVVANILFKLFC